MLRLGYRDLLAFPHGTTINVGWENSSIFKLNCCSAVAKLWFEKCPTT